MTGLIFTEIQEGAQPGGLIPPGQTEQGIPYHVSSCWVLVGGSGAAETDSRLRRAQRRFGSGERGAVFCGLCSAGLFCVLPFSVSLLFLFLLFAVLLTALILTHQFLPVSFRSPPHPGGGRGGRVVLLLLAAAKPEHIFREVNTRKPQSN